MAEETKVEPTIEQDTIVEPKTEEVGIDYDKELEEVTRKTQAQAFYEKRHQEKPEVLEETDLAKKVADQLRPEIRSILEENTRNSRLDAVSGGNQSKRALIEFHLKNSVNPNLDFETRLENAVAISNKRALAKSQSEINISQQNRAQISNSGLGANTETQQRPGANQLSTSQTQEIEKRANAMASAFRGTPEAKARVKANFIKNAADALSRK